jgi:ubiquinone/menaquinone biosynthesis C-methylase UbiE
MQLDEVQKAAQLQFARQSQRYGSSHILADISDVAAALSHIELAAGSRVLDVATGGGHTGLYLAGLGHQVTLSDLALPMLEHALELASQRGVTVETRQHPAEQFPYPDACFDLVTCRVAAHHFSSPEAFVSESARVLKPGGAFLLIDGSVENDQAEAEEWIHRVEKLRDPTHHRLLTPAAWAQLCLQHGLTVTWSQLDPFKQPDLDWYFETAATPALNRLQVRALITNAPDSARRLFALQQEEGRTVWWWPRLTLVAQR